MPISQLPIGENGRLFACPMPFSGYDPENQLLQALLARDVKTVVMLVSDEEARSATGLDLRSRYREAGLQVLQLPVPDMAVPDPESLRQTINETERLLAGGQAVAVHCLAGRGRTGLFTACLGKRMLGLDGPAALSWVRQYIPGAVETRGQENFLMHFEG